MALNGDLDGAAENLELFFNQLRTTLTGTKTISYKLSARPSKLRFSAGICVGTTTQSQPERLQTTQVDLLIKKTEFQDFEARLVQFGNNSRVQKYA